MILLRIFSLSMLLCFFSCKQHTVEADPYDGKNWVEFRITHPDADTIRGRFESISNDPLEGGTYFKANDFTVCCVDEEDNINSRHKLFFLTFGGLSAGTYYTNNDSTPMFLDLSTDEYPSVFFPDTGRQPGTVDIQEYGSIGKRISGKFSYRVHWGISPVIWEMVGSFSVIRNPDNLTDTLFSYSEVVNYHRYLAPHIGLISSH